MSRGLESFPPLEVYLLGVVDFDDVQRLQRRLIYDLGEKPGGALILCEHPPTISVGRSGSRAHIKADDDVLREANVRVRWVNRGGGVVLHLPGQLSVYVLLNLEALGLDLGAYLEGLNRVVIGVLEDFDLNGITRPEAPGVFLGYSRVGSVGVAINRWIAYHGFTLNVGFDLEPIELLLDEPGVGPYALRQTSMEARRQRPAPMAKVREAVVRHVESTFGLESRHVFSDHPLLRKEARDRAYVPSLG